MKSATEGISMESYMRSGISGNCVEEVKEEEEEEVGRKDGVEGVSLRTSAMT